MESLEQNDVISKEDANSWRDQIKRNESIWLNDSKEIKSSLDKLNEIGIIENNRIRNPTSTRGGNLQEGKPVVSARHLRRV